MEKSYITKGKVSNQEIADIYSKMLGRKVSVGDDEYCVRDNLNNPSYSADYPTLALAKKDYPNAIICY